MGRPCWRGPIQMPVRLTRAFTGSGSNLLVSSQHGVLVGRGANQAMARATHLARLDGNQVRLALGTQAVT